jgi:hypothetical protein
MYIKEIGWEAVDWVRMAQDRDSCEHGNEYRGFIKCWEVLEKLKSY